MTSSADGHELAADASDVVLIPIEDLGPSGITDACERRMLERASGAVRVRHLFDAAFSRVWRASSALARKAPDVYPPPRLANVPRALPVGRGWRE